MKFEIKEICKKCEENIHCQGKGCAYRSLGNEYCDEVENANNLVKNLQKQNTELKDNWNELKEDISHILEVIEHNKDVIKVTSDEELAIYSLQDKMQEIERL